jgi:hypothetical protein
MIGLALVEIMILWCAILLTIVTFWRVERLAALLLIPYILWVTFAIVLNAYLFKVFFLLYAKSTCSWRYFGDKENILNPSLYPMICQNKTGLTFNQTN